MEYTQASIWVHEGKSKSLAVPSKGLVIQFARRYGALELGKYPDIKLTVGRTGSLWFLTFRFRPLPLVFDSGGGSLRSHIDYMKRLRMYVPVKALGELQTKIPMGQWQGTMKKAPSGVGYDVSLQKEEPNGKQP